MASETRNIVHPRRRLPPEILESLADNRAFALGSLYSKRIASMRGVLALNRKKGC
jgi:hypothetical protein